MDNGDWVFPFIVWSAAMIIFGGFLENKMDGPEAFTKKHIKTPYCIEREIGHEKIKKCYIAVEVK